MGTSSLYATAAVEAVARSAVPQDTDVRVTRGLSVSPENSHFGILIPQITVLGGKVLRAEPHKWN